jgi:hypothetical protein
VVSYYWLWKFRANGIFKGVVNLIFRTMSDLKGMLKLRPDHSQEIDIYLVRCAEIPNARDRMFFEHFAISILQPTFNK